MQREPLNSPSIMGSAGGDAIKRRVQRHSPHRLLRKKLVLPGGITISAEKHRGRIVVRVELPSEV